VSANGIRLQLAVLEETTAATEATKLAALRTARASGTAAQVELARSEWLLASGVHDEVANALRPAGKLVDP
jgi:hypothetical protein